MGLAENIYIAIFRSLVSSPYGRNYQPINTQTFLFRKEGFIIFIPREAVQFHKIPRLGLACINLSKKLGAPLSSQLGRE